MLGRRRSVDDVRTLRMLEIVDVLPASPMTMMRDQAVPATTSLYLNDQIGDCTAVSEAALVEVWTDYGRTAPLATITDVITAYSTGSGYRPGEPATDVGADMLTMLKQWRTIGLGPHRIDAFASVDHAVVNHVCDAINLFGGVYVGANLPLTSQHEGEWLTPQTVDGENTPGSWGGHCMAGVGYDKRGIWLRTWGRRQFAEWGWWHKYVDECYAPLAPEWIHGDEAPNGLNMNKLRAYLSALGV